MEPEKLDRVLGRVAARLEEAVGAHPADAAARQGLRKAFDAHLHPRAGKGRWGSKGMP
jgi:hypothetical protein